MIIGVEIRPIFNEQVTFARESNRSTASEASAVDTPQIAGGKFKLRLLHRLRPRRSQRLSLSLCCRQ